MLTVVCTAVVVGVVLYAHHKHLSVVAELKAIAARIDSKFDGGSKPQ